MIFYIATDENGRRHLAGTQADARAIDKGFVQHDIPDDKPNRLLYVQALLTEVDELREQLAGQERVADAVHGKLWAADAAAETAPPPPPPPPSTVEVRPMNAIEISEAILDLEGTDFERVLRATIEQLGCLRAEGYSGLEAMRKRDPWFLDNVRARTSIERGLGYLLLEAHPDN